MNWLRSLFDEPSSDRTTLTFVGGKQDNDQTSEQLIANAVREAAAAPSIEKKRKSRRRRDKNFIRLERILDIRVLSKGGQDRCYYVKDKKTREIFFYCYQDPDKNASETSLLQQVIKHASKSELTQHLHEASSWIVQSRENRRAIFHLSGIFEFELLRSINAERLTSDFVTWSSEMKTEAVQRSSSTLRSSVLPKNDFSSMPSISIGSTASTSQIVHGMVLRRNVVEETSTAQAPVAASPQSKETRHRQTAPRRGRMIVRTPYLRHGKVGVPIGGGLTLTEIEEAPVKGRSPSPSLSRSYSRSRSISGSSSGSSSSYLSDGDDESSDFSTDDDDDADDDDDDDDDDDQSLEDDAMQAIDRKTEGGKTSSNRKMAPFLNLYFKHLLARMRDLHQLAQVADRDLLSVLQWKFNREGRSWFCVNPTIASLFADAEAFSQNAAASSSYQGILSAMKTVEEPMS